MKKIFVLCTVLLMSFLITGCSTQDVPILKSSITEDTIIVGDGEITIGESDIKSGDTVVISEYTLFSTTSGEGIRYSSGDGYSIGTVQQAGQMTASVWNDVKNYDFYLSLFESNQDNEDGIFLQFLELDIFDTMNLVEVTVQHEARKLKGVVIELVNNNQDVIYSAITNVNGQAFLFPKTNQLDSIANIVIKYESETVTQTYSYSKETNSINVEFTSNAPQEDVIEIMFVIDTTGSMADEMSYLKAEIEYVINQVSTSNPNSEIRLALLFYRDYGDEYLTKYFDFTTDIEQQKYNLSAQSAAGGGDFEEAVDFALDEAVTKNWGEGNTTKILFHVLDAPPHSSQEEMATYYTSIYYASRKGIRIIPIASSGINKYTEYLLRNEAMMTGGTYVYITGHSGIGGDHIDATVGEVEVEYLNNLMIRLINEYHTGVQGEIKPFITGDQE